MEEILNVVTEEMDIVNNVETAEKVKGKVQEQTDKSPSKNAAERIKKLKENLALNPYSIAIAPHTEEGHTLSYMTLWADRLIWALRKKAGVTIEPDKLTQHTKAIQGIIEKLYYLVGNPLADNTADLASEDKFRIARMRRSWIVLPKTAEGRTLAYCVKRFDPLIMQIKATENTEVLLQKLQGFLSVLIEFDEVLRTLSEELIRVSPAEKKFISYKPHRLVKKLLNSKKNQTDMTAEG